MDLTEEQKEAARKAANEVPAYPWSGQYEYHYNFAERFLAALSKAEPVAHLSEIYESLQPHAPDSAARIAELEAEVERFKRLWDAAEDHNHTLRTDTSALNEKLRMAREALRFYATTNYDMFPSTARKALATIGE